MARGAAPPRRRTAARHPPRATPLPWQRPFHGPFRYYFGVGLYSARFARSELAGRGGVGGGALPHFGYPGVWKQQSLREKRRSAFTCCCATTAAQAPRRGGPKDRRVNCTQHPHMDIEAEGVPIGVLNPATPISELLEHLAGV